MGGDPIQVAKPSIAFVMVDIDEEGAPGDARADRPKAFEAGRIGGDDTVELAARLRLVKDVIRVQKLVFLGHAILIPTKDFLALVA